MCWPKPACSMVAAPLRIGSATKHFVSAYPKIKLEADQIYVRDDNIWTSAGISAGIDLALAMVADDYGDEIAQKNRAAARAVPPPLGRAVAIFIAAGTEGAGGAVWSAARLGARNISTHHSPSRTWPNGLA